MLVSADGDATRYPGYVFEFQGGVLKIVNAKGRAAGAYALRPRQHYLTRPTDPRKIDFFDFRSVSLRTAGVFKIQDNRLFLCVRHRLRPTEFKTIHDERRSQNHTALYILERRDDNTGTIKYGGMLAGSELLFRPTRNEIDAVAEMLQAYDVEGEFFLVDYFIGGINKLTIEIRPQKPLKTFRITLIPAGNSWKPWSPEEVQRIRRWRENAKSTTNTSAATKTSTKVSRPADESENAPSTDPE